jgi:hypothetical protein
VANDYEDQLTRIEQRYGVRLPADYRRFIVERGTIYEDFPDAGDWLQLYPPDQLVPLAEAGEHQQRFPGGLAIGGNGSREVLFYDLRKDPPPPVLLDITAPDWSGAFFQATSFTDFLTGFPERGWSFDEAYTTD